MDIGRLENGAHRAAPMALNGGNQASPSDPSLPMEEILVIPEIGLPIPAPMASNQASPPLLSVSVYRKGAIILCIYVSAGTICFYLVRHQISGKKTNSVLDALYMTFVSMTCVGYGDLSPDGTLSILLVSLFSIMGVLLIGLVLSKAADILIEKQEQLLEKTDHGSAKLQEQKESNKLRNKCIMLAVLLVVLMAVGTAVLVSVEDLDLIHAFYCINATVTSVGSKKCFSTRGGRVFALFWMLIGAIYVGQILFTFTEIHAQRRQRSLRRWVIEKKLTISDMLEADIDGDGILKISEYILHKLKEMRKISREDIVPILNDFHRRDINKTGGAHPDPVVRRANGGNQATPTGPPDEMTDFDPESFLIAYSRVFKFYFSMKRVLMSYYLYMGVGTLCFYLIRHQISGTKTNGFVDALYFTYMLMTSVGYGDLTPETNLAILLAALCSFLGKVIMGIILAALPDMFMEEKEALKNMDCVADRNEEIHKQMTEPIKMKWRMPALLFAFHIVVGTAILVPVEDLDLIHAFYCICATITSVSSSKCFSTKGGRLFAYFWILYALCISAWSLFTFTELQTQRRRQSLFKESLKQKETPEELQVADLDDDGVLVPAEYILHKLKEIGKISREDMTPIIEEFRRLDVNNKGELTRADIMP